MSSWGRGSDVIEQRIAYLLADPAVSGLILGIFKFFSNKILLLLWLIESSTETVSSREFWFGDGP